MFLTHPHPPDARVEAKIKTEKYAKNSVVRGMALRSFCANGFGDARCDVGLLSRRRTVGGSRRMDGRERWERRASVSRDSDIRPLVVGCKIRTMYARELDSRREDEHRTLRSEHQGEELKRVVECGRGERQGG